MGRTTRATKRGEHVDENAGFHTASPNTSHLILQVPRRPSCTPSVAGIDFPGSDSTIRDEDANSQEVDKREDDAMQSFGQRSRKLIKVIQKLEALGIGAQLSSLPKFVVVGDQSHGKSSVIEAICGISLPRSAGTCTRCPFKITTTAAKPGDGWSCKISLSRRWTCRNSKAWQDTGNMNPVFFAEVTDRADLERVLRLAQVAVLNPHVEAATLLQGAAPNTGRGLSFSQNQIELQISGEELPELSMLDLPGSINVAPDETEQHLVGLIAKMIKSYISDEKALVLLVASSDQDFETSTAFRFIGDRQALGRSMGVMTKPDLLTNGRVELVRQTLAGKRFKLGHAWFVTKGSSQEQIDSSITHSEARQMEEAFFREAPWGTVLMDFEDRFGTKNLQNALSHQLVEHIEKELPEIIQRVDERLRSASEQLDLMSERPSNPSQTVIEELQKLVGAIMLRLSGNDDNVAFRTGIKALLRGFRARLQSGRPHVILSTPGYVKPVLSVDSDDDTMSEAPPTPSKKQKTTNHTQPASSPQSRSEGRVLSNDRQHVTGAVFTLDKIHSALDQARGSDMPDQIHPKVTERFIRQSIRLWPTVVSELMEAVQRHTGDMLAECITEALATRAGTALFDQAMKAMQTVYNGIHVAEVVHIDHLVNCEMYKPITYAGGLKTEEVKSTLQTGRTAQRVDEYYDTLEASSKNSKVPIGQKRKELTKDLSFVTKTLGADKYATEVGAMASPLAYYDLAAARLTDTVANHLEYGILHTLEEKLQLRLMLELRVNNAEYCEELLAEDPAREEERQRLLAEQNKLLKAVEELKGLPGAY